MSTQYNLIKLEKGLSAAVFVFFFFSLVITMKSYVWSINFFVYQKRLKASRKSYVAFSTC